MRWWWPELPSGATLPASKGHGRFAGASESRPFFSRMKLSFRAWLVIREGSAHAGVRRTTTRPDLGCGKAAKKGRGELFLARQFAAAVTALFLAAGAFFVFLFTVSDLHAKDPGSSCAGAAEVAVLSSPIAPWRGAPLRVVFAAEESLEGELSLIAPDGKAAAKSRELHGGPPYFWFAEVASPAVGMWQARLVREGAPAGCDTVTRKIAVSRIQAGPPRATPGSVWPVRDAWNRGTENLYSAWVEKLFDAPLDEELSWPALHEVLRDKSRNFLFNHLGLREDEKGIIISPRLRRPSILFARVFRVQDGPTVRVLEVHARRWRRAAEVPAVVEHSERGAPSRSARTKHRVSRHVRDL